MQAFFQDFFPPCCFYSVGGLLWIAFDRKLNNLSFLEQSIFYCWEWKKQTTKKKCLCLKCYYEFDLKTILRPEKWEWGVRVPSQTAVPESPWWLLGSTFWAFLFCSFCFVSTWSGNRLGPCLVSGFVALMGPFLLSSLSSVWGGDGSCALAGSLTLGLVLVPPMSSCLYGSTSLSGTCWGPGVPFVLRCGWELPPPTTGFAGSPRLSAPWVVSAGVHWLCRL